MLTGWALTGFKKEILQYQPKGKKFGTTCGLDSSGSG
jgi:hypothetical protein